MDSYSTALYRLRGNAYWTFNGRAFSASLLLENTESGQQTLW